MSAEAAAANDRLARAMTTTSDPSALIEDLAGAQTRDPQRFAAEYRDILRRYHNALPEHRRDEYRRFKAKADRALGWTNGGWAQQLQASQADAAPQDGGGGGGGGPVGEQGGTSEVEVLQPGPAAPGGPVPPDANAAPKSSSKGPTVSFDEAGERTMFLFSEFQEELATATAAGDRLLLMEEALLESLPTDPLERQAFLQGADPQGFTNGTYVLSDEGHQNAYAARRAELNAAIDGRLDPLLERSGLPPDDRNRIKDLFKAGALLPDGVHFGKLVGPDGRLYERPEDMDRQHPGTVWRAVLDTVQNQQKYASIPDTTAREAAAQEIIEAARTAKGLRGAAPTRMVRSTAEIQEAAEEFFWSATRALIER